MAKKAPARSVRCYLCDHGFEVPGQAVTTSCPACFKRLVVEDIVVRHAQGNTVLGTCGRLVVAPKAQIVARRIRAIEGAQIDGTIESAVETDGTVHLGARARFKGDCRARALVVEPGAVILSGFFSIGPDAPPLPARTTIPLDDGAAIDPPTRPAPSPTSPGRARAGRATNTPP